jgi:HD-GYP domain-containing protein (c-di-GMP phosphodiesterase class II)
MGAPHLNNNYFEELINIGISLSKEKDINILLENILTQARKISNSDGGTLYIADKNFTKLDFVIMQNKSKNIFLGGTKSPVPNSIYPVKLFSTENNEPNHKNVSAVCALKNTTIKIDDAYENKEYDFEGTKGFDSRHDYYSKCLLNIPMKDHKDNVIGVIQLLNPMKNGKIIKYSKEIIKVIESLTSQASIALTNQLLIKEQKNLFKSFIKLVAEALEHKDATTGGHCNRVPEITMMIANVINDMKNGVFKNFKFNEEEMEELYVAGWLHDFGKVATPEHVMNKSTKLEGLYDKIDHIKIRFEVLKKDIKIKYYDLIYNNNDDISLKNKMNEEINKADNELEFIIKCNTGGESFSKELKEKVKEISKYKIYYNGSYQNILTNEEVDFLTLERGTLSKKERQIMEDHVSLTYELLNKLPYPKHLNKVPFYAGCHHEKINGKGYPNGYSGDELPIQARIIALADVFEGLTASDRPYKDGYKLSKAMNILKFMILDNELDKDIFNLFINQKIYLKYAEDYIKKSQIDKINEKDLLV